MSLDYITSGPPSFSANPNPSLLLDEVNANLYVSIPGNTSWIIIGNSGGSNDAVQGFNTNGNITFLGQTNTFVKATGGASGISLNLPDAIGNSGQQITVIKIDASAGNVTLVALVEPQQETINGQDTYVLTNQYQSVTLESDNANWFVRSTAN
jgi:hypothetical protein